MSRYRRLPTVVALAMLAASAVGGVVPVAQAATGCSTVSDGSDFNGDDYSDVVVADPDARVNGRAGAGQVTVLYGGDDADQTPGGTGPRAVVNQNSIQVADVAEAGDHFGAAVAAADLNCDGYTDLLVGVPGEDLAGQADSGLVQVVFGGGDGLQTRVVSRQIDQTTFGLHRHRGDRLGYAVDAASHVSTADPAAPRAYAGAVAVGMPGYDVYGAGDAGAVGFVVGDDIGRGAGDRISSVSQDTEGVPGSAEAGDRFGSAVSLSYLIGARKSVDAVVGVPDEDIGTAVDAGAVTIVGDVDRDHPSSGVALSQDSVGVPGVAETGDHFGRSLDTHQHAGATLLAVGAPTEDIGSAEDAGSVQLFGSSGSSLQALGSLSQDTRGVGGVAEAGDEFGAQVVFFHNTAVERGDDLAVSAPGEDGPAVDTGEVQLFPVTDLADEETLGQNSPGVPGTAAAHNRFGTSLGAVDGRYASALLIGVPDDRAYPGGQVTRFVRESPGTTIWAPGHDGIPAAGAKHFGAVVGRSAE